MFCFLLVAVSTVEFAVMFILQTFLPGLFGNKLALVDASLTALCILPFAKIFFARFGDRLHAPAPTDLIASPVILYSAILYMVFVADAIQESFQPLLIPKGFEDYFLLVDSTLTTLIVAPFIWIMVGRPLIKGVRDEKIRTETILDQVVEAVIALDSNGKILSMNPPAERIFGYKSLELAGRAITEIFSEQPLDMEQLIDDFSDSKSGQKGVIFRNRTCRHRNGALIFLDISVSSVQQQGRKELLLILHDITQYKETERALRERDERFQQIFEQADDAIAFFQPKTCKYIDVNETFAKLFGFTKAEIIKLELENLIAPSDIDMVKQAIMQTVRGRPRNINNLRGLRGNGGQFNMSMRSKLLTVDNIDIVQCSFRDITDRIRLEMEAKEIQTKLIQTNKMTSLGLMVSGVAHEINNPNNFILNNSRILEKSWDDISKILHEYYLEHGDYSLGGIPFTEVGEHFPKLLSGISDGSTRIAKIIYNLKNFYRPINVREDNLDINRVVSSAVSLLQHELVKHTKKFEIKLS
ncbi:MAG: PAS domain S-box protein, partial [Desulfuromonadales bacterium]